MRIFGESRGWLRTIGSAMAGIGALLVSIPDPQCVAVGAILLKVGGIIGGAGVVRAAAAKGLPHQR